MTEVLLTTSVLFRPAFCEGWIAERLVLDSWCQTCATGSLSADLAGFAKKLLDSRHMGHSAHSD